MNNAETDPCAHKKKLITPAFEIQITHLEVVQPSKAAKEETLPWLQNEGLWLQRHFRQTKGQLFWGEVIDKLQEEQDNLTNPVMNK